MTKADSRIQIERLRKALVICKDSIVHEMNCGSIVDTIWVPHQDVVHQTLFDFIESILDGSGDPKIVTKANRAFATLSKQQSQTINDDAESNIGRLDTLKKIVRDADGPSADLNSNIKSILSEMTVCRVFSDEKMFRLFGGDDLDCIPFTSSIDASVALIEGLLPDLLWDVYLGAADPSGNGPYWTSLYTLKDPSMPIENGLDPTWGEGSSFPGRTACLSALNALISTLHALGEGEATPRC